MGTRRDRVHSGVHAPAAAADYPAKGALLLRLLSACSALLPGDRLKTLFYLSCIDAPRRFVRDALFAFYRFDHVYAVLRELRAMYRGNFSVLEFGTSDGYAFAKLLYATRYLGLENRVTVHGFDSFEGMPRPVDEKDEDWIARDNWVPGQFKGSYEALDAYCADRLYSNYALHRGYFEQSVDDALLAQLADWPPILVWIDSDYYSSARTVLERLIDHLPNGCVVYFDEFDNLNFGSRLTGEARLVHEINTGLFGDNIELVPDVRLSLYSRRIYRFFRLPPNRTLVRIANENSATLVHHPSGGSPLP